MSQTIIQNQPSIRAGSLKVELGNSLGSMVDIGAFQSIAGLEGTGRVVDIIYDNVPKSSKYVDGNRAKFAGDLVELNFDNIALMNGGQIVTTSIPGTLVAGNVETIASGDWSFDMPFELAGQNSDGTIPTINSVTASVTGALTLGTDYNMVKMTNGNWAIVILTGAIAGTESVDVDSDYTPSASKKTIFNATGIKSGVYMRLTNTNENGKKWIATLKGVVNIAPFSIDFAGDNEDGVAKMPVELEGEVIEIIDEQNA